MMKIKVRNTLTVAAIVVIATIPALTYAACGDGNPATWDSSDYIPRTAKIGLDTVISANVSIGGYDVIGTCNTIGNGLDAVALGSRARLGDDVSISGVSRVAGSARVGNSVTINGATVGSSVIIGDGSSLSGSSYLGSSTRLGISNILVGAKLGSSVILGDDVLVGQTVGSDTGGVSIGGSSKIGYMQIPASATASGPTTIQPNVSIAGDVNIGIGVTVEDGAIIRNSARIYSGVTIGTGADIGGHDVICASVPSGMKFPSYYRYGC
jgi:UDP-3-O-[3-hydroxymyristoyl] glucosamine N-acyltransferase